MSDLPTPNRRNLDRRKGPSLQEIAEDFQQKLDEQSAELRAYVDSAFPKKQGETASEAIANHKRYHDGLIKTSEKWDKIWTDIFTTIAKGGLWFLVAVIAAALWQAFIAEVKK